MPLMMQLIMMVGSLEIMAEVDLVRGHFPQILITILQAFLLEVQKSMEMVTQIMTMI